MKLSVLSHEMRVLLLPELWTRCLRCSLVFVFSTLRVVLICTPLGAILVLSSF